ncbi:hypothetical protein [Paenibacillus agilis]|uniref:Uncharacterized protein n=1 Tax=Paenibacillus agilis TaxID=3020863 RepID=A0A559IEZ3_9BACL|nr:hypothetical protein [Paenibacillus agilis]TVX86043.1 hypothetical protein FPZ44_24175 [Paenibacillus agilis]
MAKQIARETEVIFYERETYMYESKEEASQHDSFMIAAGWLRVDQYEWKGAEGTEETMFFQIFTKKFLQRSEERK